MRIRDWSSDVCSSDLVGHTYAEHRARNDIDDHIDIRFWHAEGQRDRLDPLPVRVGFEVKFGVFGPDHAASSIVSKPKGRNQRRSLRTRARSCSRMIDERWALAPAAPSADTDRKSTRLNSSH